MTKQKKNTWKSAIRNTAAGALCGLAALVSGCGSNGKLVDTETLTHPYVETALVSDYVYKQGAVVHGQQRQDLVATNINDRLSSFFWQNYSHAESAINERAYGLSYTIPLSDKLSVRGGYQYWEYPTASFEDDQVLTAGAHYSTLVELDLDITQLLAHDKIKSGTRYYLQASKNFNLGKVAECDISLKPSISTAYVDNFYGNSGKSQITPGINLGISKGNFSLNFFVNSQNGMQGNEDFTWSGVSAGWKF